MLFRFRLLYVRAVRWVFVFLRRSLSGRRRPLALIDLGVNTQIWHEPTQARHAG
jgi:hypothetical protein